MWREKKANEEQKRVESNSTISSSSKVSKQSQSTQRGKLKSKKYVEKTMSFDSEWKVNYVFTGKQKSNEKNNNKKNTKRQTAEAKSGKTEERREKEKLSPIYGC